MSMLKRFLVLLVVCAAVGGAAVAQDVTYKEAPMLAVIGGVFLVVMYLAAVFAGFIAPNDPTMVHSKFVSMGPQGLNFMDTEGDFHLVPFAYGLKSAVDPATFRKTFEIIPEEKYPLQFFVHGPEYTILGVIKSDIHLFGVDEPGKLFLFGTDSQGRDIFSRVWYGAQVSLSVGLFGVFLTLLFGSIIGIASGYIGRQRAGHRRAASHRAALRLADRHNAGG